jgi:hypothetical protein
MLTGQSYVETSTRAPSELSEPSWAPRAAKSHRHQSTTTGSSLLIGTFGLVRTAPGQYDLAQNSVRNAPRRE